jgi:hypothetical protein
VVEVRYVAFDLERREPRPPRVRHREIRPPTPRSEATVYAVTKGNIAKLAAMAVVALIIVLLSVRTMGYRGEQCNGGEGVSQSPLKDKAFSTFLNQNPPFELRPENGISPSAKACARNGAIDNSAIKRLLRRANCRHTARPDRRSVAESDGGCPSICVGGRRHERALARLRKAMAERRGVPASTRWQGYLKQTAGLEQTPTCEAHLFRTFRSG